MQMLAFIINFINRWIGAFPRVVIAFVGVLICVLVAVALWDRRMRIPGAVIGILIGLGIIFSPVLMSLFLGMQADQRLRFIGIIVSLMITGISVQAVRISFLQKRYSAIWIGSAFYLLIISINPGVLISLEKSLGLGRLELIGGSCIILLMLLVFQFSVVLSRLAKHCNLLQQRMRNLERSINSSDADTLLLQDSPNISDRVSPYFSLTSLSISSLFAADSVGRAIRGSRIGVPLVILLASLSVFLVGMAAPQAMVGDEVTHYYMLVKQAQDISKPNFYADIPMATGRIETRRYPHSFVWHYMGALVYLITGRSFAGVQLYQAFFLFQLLTVAYLLARSRGGIESRSALLYVLTLASLPLCLIFSATFYQDVPMTAQAMTAFYLLNRRHWLPASIFMALAIGFKVTAVLFFPAFFILVLFWETKKGRFWHGVLAFFCSVLIVLGSTWTLGKAINIYGQAGFYPQEKLEILSTVIADRVKVLLNGGKQESVAHVVEKKRVASAQYVTDKTPETNPVVIANHPGDLRIKENFLVYGGLLFWLVIFIGGIACLPKIRTRYPITHTSNMWLLGVGGSFLIVTAYMIKLSPDARFFLPGLPFVLLPVVEQVVRLPKTKLIITLLTSLALLQSGYVLNKTYRLRVVSPGIHEGINYLKSHPTNPRRIFMYPEGNYRLFPMEHEWYLGYRLREFWRSDNDKRIEMLKQYSIGAIVIKKQLITSVDKEITNLGVYPPQFVSDLQRDSRFIKAFENNDLLIFLSPVSRSTGAL
jgi:hypothetical protein